MAGQLIHRDAELAAIGDLITELQAGRPAILVIQGGRGTGKTALLHAAAVRAHEIGTVLLARCHPTERDFPFGMVRQLFDRPAQVPGDGSPVHGVLEGLFQATRSLAAARPVVIGLDDVGAADPPSLQWCAYLGRRLDGLPVAMILTAHPADRASEELLRSLGALHYCRRIRPRPICARCTDSYLATVYDRAVHPQFAAACHRVSQGNARILRDLARRLGEAAVPPDESGLAKLADFAAATLSETALVWLRESDPSTVELAAGLAVLGDDGDLETAAVLCGKGDLSARQARLTLQRAGLLQAGPRDRFAHDTIRDAVLARLGPEQRTELHGRAAGLLFRLGAPARQIARHLMSVGPADNEWAIAVLRQAAGDAAAEGAWDEAIRYLRRALAENAEPGPDRTRDLLAELGAAELHCDLPTSMRHIENALSLAGTADDRAASLARVANPAFTLAVPGFAGEFAAAARQLDGPAFLAIAGQALLAGQPTGTARAVRLAATDGACAGDFLAALAVCTAALGRSRPRVARLVARCGGEDGWLTSAAPSLTALAHVWADELADAERQIGAALVLARRRGSLSEAALALVVASEIAYRTGQLEIALDRALEAADLAAKSRAGDLQAAAVAGAARVRIERGELSPARELLRVAPSAGAHPLVWVAHTAALAQLADAEGAPREVIRLYLDCGHRLTGHGIANPACLPWRSRAALGYLAAGQPGVARELADEEVRYARRWGTGGTLGVALSVAGAARGPVAGMELLVRGANLLAGGADRLEHARALLRLGTALREAGAAARGREALSHAVELAEHLGAVRVADLARTELRGNDGRGRPRAGHGPLVLTAGELRVAELVVGGMSNLEVANALSISKRTVDTHLAHVYRKLGIRSRASLADALRGQADG